MKKIILIVFVMCSVVGKSFAATTSLYPTGASINSYSTILYDDPFYGATLTISGYNSLSINGQAANYIGTQPITSDGKVVMDFFVIQNIRISVYRFMASGLISEIKFEY